MASIERRSFVTILLLLVFGSASKSNADTLRLRDGSTATGTFLGGTPRQIRLEVNGVIKTYSAQDVLGIVFDGGIPPAPPLALPPADNPSTPDPKVSLTQIAPPSRTASGGNSVSPNLGKTAYNFEVIATVDGYTPTIRGSDINDNGDIAYRVQESGKDQFSIVTPKGRIRVGQQLDNVTLLALGKPYINNNGSVAFSARYGRPTANCPQCVVDGVFLNGKIVVETNSTIDGLRISRLYPAVTDQGLAGTEPQLVLDDQDNVFVGADASPPLGSGPYLLLKNKQIIARSTKPIVTFGANSGGMVKYLTNGRTSTLFDLCDPGGNCADFPSHNGMGTFASHLFIPGNGPPVVGYLPLLIRDMNENGVGVQIGFGKELSLQQGDTAALIRVVDGFGKLLRLTKSSNQGAPSIQDASINNRGQIAFIFYHQKTEWKITDKPSTNPTQILLGPIHSYSIIRATPAPNCPSILTDPQELAVTAQNKVIDLIKQYPSCHEPVIQAECAKLSGVDVAEAGPALRLAPIVIDGIAAGSAILAQWQRAVIFITLIETGKLLTSVPNVKQTAAVTYAKSCAKTENFDSVLYHYTSMSDAAAIKRSGFMVASFAFSKTLPSGAYATNIRPKTSGWTHELLSRLFYGDNPRHDMSWFVEIDNTTMEFRWIGYQGRAYEWVKEAPVGTRVPVKVLSIGEN
jgi:hypothetical protein